jgi:tetratricopeptide (TPR) repeat protein
MNFRLVCASFVLFAAACQSSSGDGKPIDRLSEVDRLSAHGEYAEALVVAEAYHRNHPDDEAGERQYRRARAAVMLDQARALCFADKNLEALEQVRQAMLIEPDESVIADWELKLTRKLAYLAAAAGDEQFASSDLDGAREQYELALSYAPDDVNAKAALSQVLLQINYRRGDTAPSGQWPENDREFGAVGLTNRMEPAQRLQCGGAQLSEAGTHGNPSWLRQLSEDPCQIPEAGQQRSRTRVQGRAWFEKFHQGARGLSDTGLQLLCLSAGAAGLV